MPILYESYAPKPLLLPKLQPKRVSFAKTVDERYIASLSNSPKAGLLGIRTYDNIAKKWYEVYPEEKPAKCTPGSNALHVVFGAKNIGDQNGNLYGLLTDDTAKVIIPVTLRYCTVGKFVWWEKTFNMPLRTYKLEIELGHDE